MNTTRRSLFALVSAAVATMGVGLSKANANVTKLRRVTETTWGALSRPPENTLLATRVRDMLVDLGTSGTRYYFDFRPDKPGHAETIRWMQEHGYIGPAIEHTKGPHTATTYPLTLLGVTSAEEMACLRYCEVAATEPGYLDYPPPRGGLVDALVRRGWAVPVQRDYVFNAYTDRRKLAQITPAGLRMGDQVLSARY